MAGLPGYRRDKHDISVRTWLSMACTLSYVRHRYLEAPTPVHSGTWWNNLLRAKRVSIGRRP